MDGRSWHINAVKKFSFDALGNMVMPTLFSFSSDLKPSAWFTLPSYVLVLLFFLAVSLTYIARTRVPPGSLLHALSVFFAMISVLAYVSCVQSFTVQDGENVVLVGMSLDNEHLTKSAQKILNENPGVRTPRQLLFAYSGKIDNDSVQGVWTSISISWSRLIIFSLLMASCFFTALSASVFLNFVFLHTGSRTGHKDGGLA